MSRIDESPTFRVTPATIGARRMVKIDTGVTDLAPARIKVCGITGIPHAVSKVAGATGDLIAVDMFPWGKNGTYEVEVVIATAIVVGTALYTAAGGRLTDHATASGSYKVAVALQKAPADYAHIQVMPSPWATFLTG